MSPRTGRPPKNGKSRTEHSLNLRLTEDEAIVIQSLAEYFNLSRTDTIIGSIRYLQDQIKEYDFDLEKYLERRYEEYCEHRIEQLQMAYEDNILEELEQFELDQLEYFESETLVTMEETAEEYERDFDRESAIEDFKSNELQKLVEEERKEIENRYQEEIEKEVEKEWESEEKYYARRCYFEISD